MTSQPPNTVLDPRLNAYRPDLAAEHLKGRIEAQHYVPGSRHQVRRPLVPMRQRPDTSAPIINEAIYGEVVWVYEQKDGWAWCQLDRDEYVGYVPSTMLSPDLLPPTHRVAALGTFVYRRSDIKSEPVMQLPLNAAVTVTGTEDRFYALAGGGFLISRHVVEISRYTRDFVQLAERLIDTPYLWGGRSRFGIDCSGLVQLSMEAAGLPCPRDSDMQAGAIGAEMPVREDLEGLQRGDLVFWPGHVGIMVDGVMLVHANAHHMVVIAEPLVTAARRIERAGSRISRIRRPPALAASAIS
ncbi:MAG: hypothetical protein RLZ98_470 [Pseudomonadota bacterium]|jgi:cell wall-associated NlpC family hydrolase